MSYCRFSDDSDVYTYEDVHGGWTTWVAARRLIVPDDAPEYPDIHALLKNTTDEERSDTEHPAVKEWIRQHTIYQDYRRDLVESDDNWLDLSDLPDAKGHFNDPTPEACAATLMRLRLQGFVVPQYAIDALLEEAKGEE